MSNAPWLFFPDYRASNPYQALLAHALAPSFEARGGTIEDALRFGAADVVFHLHWEDAVHATSVARGDAAVRIERFLADLDAFRAAGGRCVWTIHNAAPHEDRHPDLSAAFRRALIARVDLVHVHGDTAAAMMAAEGCAPDGILVMPHPNFRDAYPDDITDEAARRHLGFSKDHTVFAFLGAMRAYKGLEVLADAFVRLQGSGLPAGLILAGRPGGPADVARIATAFAPAASAIRLLPRHVDDCAVQYVMRAADYVVLPYHAVLTSGSMMLALGFSRPVIVPALPTLLDVVRPGQDSLAFRPGDAESLHDSLLTATGHDAETRAAMRRAARATADAASFSQLARALMWWAGAAAGSGRREARAA